HIPERAVMQVMVEGDIVRADEEDIGPIVVVVVEAGAASSAGFEDGERRFAVVAEFEVDTCLLRDRGELDGLALLLRCGVRAVGGGRRGGVFGRRLRCAACEEGEKK